MAGILKFSEEIAMRAQSNHSQGLFIRFFIDQQQVGLEVAFAMVGLVSRQRMVAVLFRESLIVCQLRGDLFQ